MTLFTPNNQSGDLAQLATKADLAETKAEVLKWMVWCLMGIQAVAIIAAAYTLVRLGSH